MGRFVLDHYEKALRRAGLVDMGDLHLLAVELLAIPAVRAALQQRYRHLLVDEYQDTNLLQLSLLSFLMQRDAAAQPIGITVVGDDDQSIYSFRGAQVSLRTRLGPSGRRTAHAASSSPRCSSRYSRTSSKLSR